MLEVRDALEFDLERIMQIYSIAQDFMAKTGNPTQWGKTYPTRELVIADIKSGASKVICENKIIHGVFAMCEGVEPTYQNIEQGEWLNDEPYITIHRIASDGEVHGLFNSAVNYCKNFTNNIRIDTHKDNVIMQKLIDRADFSRCGVIYFDDGTPRIAYQKVLSL